MLRCLRALLNDTIDYAGMFPPCGLDLDTAVRNYVKYRAHDDAWMLGRLVCSASRLPELQPLIDEFCSAETPLRLSVVGGGGDTLPEYVQRLKDAAQSIAGLKASAGAAVSIDALEIRLPLNVANKAEARVEWCARDESYANEAGLPRDTLLFYEMPLAGDWRLAISDVVDRISVLGAQIRETPRAGVGFKLRCGGLQSEDFPSCEQVAFIIEACCEAQVPLKFTAGLHHPVRHYDPGVRAHMHGFLNVFIAGVLSHALGLDVNDIRGVLEEIDPRQFTLSDSSLGWSEAEAAIDEVELARRSRVISFGSCSFDEPREDLRRLGLM